MFDWKIVPLPLHPALKVEKHAKVHESTAETPLRRRALRLSSIAMAPVIQKHWTFQTSGHPAPSQGFWPCITCHERCQADLSEQHFHWVNRRYLFQHAAEASQWAHDQMGVALDESSSFEQYQRLLAGMGYQVSPSPL